MRRLFPTLLVAAALALSLTPAAATPDVPDVPVRAALLPNDTLWRYQWGPTVVRAPEAWDRKATRSPVVAVVDTGVDASHPDLRNAVLPGIDLVGDGATGDPNGHGTAVAGVIAARGRNRRGVAGYCWSCKILPVRVLDRNASGSSATVATGIDWAVAHGANVVNLSLVADQPTDLITAAVARARARGVVVVAAAGNDGTKTMKYPAASEGVLAVVATDETDKAFAWATRGTWADVGAPGCAVTTTRGTYDEACGSSIASPAVAGIIGLALATVPKATALDAEAAVLATTRRLPRGTAARGRVDAEATIARLVKTLG